MVSFSSIHPLILWEFPFRQLEKTSVSQKGKKGLKKKVVDPFTRKEWYHVLAPSTFTNHYCSKTLINRTQGLKIAVDGMKGRVFEISQGDLNKDSKDEECRKFKLCVNEVQGRNCLNSFHIMELTSNKLRA